MPSCPSGLYNGGQLADLNFWGCVGSYNTVDVNLPQPLRSMRFGCTRDLPDCQREAHRFYKSHIMGCVGDLAADVTISVRMKAAHVLCVTAQHARALGDTDMSLRTEGLRREAFSTTLQPDPSMSTSARPEEVELSWDPCLFCLA